MIMWRRVVLACVALVAVTVGYTMWHRNTTVPPRDNAQQLLADKVACSQVGILSTQAQQNLDGPVGQ